MDVPHRGADLGVGVGVDVFLEEVDQPAVALEDRQDAEVGAGRRRLEQRLDPRGERGVGQGPPECSEGQPETIQRSSPQNAS